MLKITKQAADRIMASASDSGMRGQSLRVAAKRRSDGSVEYAMGFDEIQEHDTRSQQYDIELLVAPTSADLLAGAILDYAQVDGEEEMQFIFLNPNDSDFGSLLPDN